MGQYSVCRGSLMSCYTGKLALTMPWGSFFFLQISVKHQRETSSSDDEEYYSDFQPPDPSNFSSVDSSNFYSVELSDFSNSAAAASLFLSEKLSSETRKLLTIASDKMKSTKLSSMIEEIIEETSEQRRVEETKKTILETIKVSKHFNSFNKIEIYLFLK